MKILLIFVTLFIAISACSYIGSDKTSVGMHYVNMGSSFAAGSGIPSGTKQNFDRCRQSSVNYAKLLARSHNLNLDDRSCGGAKSIHLLEPWNELPAQIEAVNLDTRLVTITVGGNDLHYVKNLLAASCSEEVGFNFEGNSLPCFQKNDNSEEFYLQLKTNLLEVTRQISTRAPRAKIVFIQYITLVPKQLCEVTPLTREQANQSRFVARRLAKITEDVAEQFGSTVLPTDILSRNHTACDAQPWSISASTSASNTEGGPWHPNRLANEVIADLLRKVLEN